ncbi:hypothetical protein WMY93_019670 [Mugilogobius chulae]|uniref:Pentraxin family member n=1 Tax=Mugilogobius chulae TaxID=88201 RepID=A0AAW0NQY1_9GOBI
MGAKMVSIYILLWLMLEIHAVHSQSLKEKMFTFPEENNTTYVRFKISRKDMNATTICLRSYTDLTRDYSLLSLNTPSSVDEILIYREPHFKNTFQVKVGDRVAEFVWQKYELNKWQAICLTWEAGSGLTQLWVNGKGSSRKLTTKSVITGGHFTIVLGQDQNPEESHRSECFVGMMRHLHVWDYVLSEQDIDTYSSAYNMIRFPHGNVLDWSTVQDFDIMGDVVVEKGQRLSN